jgi:GTP-binding protein YchF
MKLGIVGLANSGKTTLFNALTGQYVETGYFHKNEPNIAITEIKDERVTNLSKIYEPQKTIYATIEILDFPAEEEEKRKQFNTPQLKLLDAFAIVLRNFSDPIIDPTLGSADPLRDLQEIELEMVLSDLQIAEKRLEKVQLGFKRGVKTAEALFEEKVLLKVVESLQQEQPLRKLELALDEEKTLRGFQLLTQKPVMVLLNSNESNYLKNDELLDELRRKGYIVEDFAGKFEMELIGLDETDKQMFMADMGIESSARDRIIRLAYKILGYINFFTVGKDEVRAWTIANGTNAQVAAGVIHSDLQRGFIRAECFNYEELMEYGSEKVLREKGKFRLEGKTYRVVDGDIISVRFSV